MPALVQLRVVISISSWCYNVYPRCAKKFNKSLHPYFNPFSCTSCYIVNWRCNIKKSVLVNWTTYSERNTRLKALLRCVAFEPTQHAIVSMCPILLSWSSIIVRFSIRPYSCIHLIELQLLEITVHHQPHVCVYHCKKLKQYYAFWCAYVPGSTRRPKIILDMYRIFQKVFLRIF